MDQREHHRSETPPTNRLMDLGDWITLILTAICILAGLTAVIVTDLQRLGKHGVG